MDNHIFLGKHFFVYNLKLLHLHQINHSAGQTILFVPDTNCKIIIANKFPK